MVKFHAARRAFQQDVESLANDAESRPQNQHADPNRQDRVDPIVVGEQDGPASGDDGGGRERVADFVEQGAANVHVAAGTVEEESDNTVHHYSRGCHPHHHASLDVLGMLQSLEGFVEDEE